MLPLNTLPLDIIGIVIGLSILIPSLITIFLIRIRKFEELGMVIGVFLIVLSLTSYFYIIPAEIVEDTILPEEYVWEDEGDVYYWEKNSVISTNEHIFNLPSRIDGLISKRQPIEKSFKATQMIYISKLSEDGTKAIINDVLYDDKGEIFTVINGQEKISEWYGVEARLSSLEYYNVDAGRMGIPSDSEDRYSIKVGWVESNGEIDGRENVVLVRDMKKIRTGIIDGIEFCVWESNVYNQYITWHEESYICDETLRLTVEPRTGYVIHVYRNLVISAHLSQFIEIYHPDITDNSFVNRFVKSYNPVGEAAVLIYETTEESQARHIAEVKNMDMQLLYLPIIICVPMLIIGVGFLWRYGGRSYYWNRYKEFER